MRQNGAALRTRSAPGQARLDTVLTYDGGHVTRASQSVYIQGFPENKRQGLGRVEKKAHPSTKDLTLCRLKGGCK